MKALAISLDDQTVHISADGQAAEDVVAFVCAGLAATAADLPPNDEAKKNLLLRATATGGFELFNAGGVLAHRVDNKAGAVDVLIEAMVRALIWDYRRGLALHAAAITFEHGLVIFPAASGVGKSTLAVYLAARGLRFVTDELVFVPWGEQLAHPLARPAHLKPGSSFLLDQFPALRQSPAVLSSALGSFLAPAAFANRGAEPRAIGAVVFPHYIANSACRLEPLSPGAASFALLAALLNARNLPELGVAAAACFCEGIPVFKLSYGKLEDAFVALTSEALRLATRPASP